MSENAFYFAVNNGRMTAAVYRTRDGLIQAIIGESLVEPSAIYVIKELTVEDDEKMLFDYMEDVTEEIAEQITSDILAEGSTAGSRLAAWLDNVLGLSTESLATWRRITGETY